jgi:hypothetical protein
VKKFEKMHRYLVIVGLLVVCAPAGAQAEYKDLLKEWEAYEPPVYLRSMESPTPAMALNATDQAFMDEKKNLAAAAAEWREALASPSPKKVFYYPDAQLLQSLQSAVSNDEAAAQAVAEQFSLKTIEALVFLRNSGIRAAEELFLASIEDFSQVSALDEILKRYSSFTRELMSPVGPMKGKDPIAMDFPYPGVLSLKGQIAQQEVRAAWEMLEKTRRDKVTSARISFWERLYNGKAKEVASETLTLLEYLEKTATKRYEAGKTNFQDVIKIRIERDILREKLKTLEEMYQNIEAKLVELLSLPLHTKLGRALQMETTKEIPALDSLYQLALEQNQELRRKRALIDKMERMVEMVETMVIPPFTLNLSLYENDAANKVGFTATKETFPVKTKGYTGTGLPKMPWFGSNDAYLRKTKQKLQALREDLKENEAVTLTMVREAWFDLDLARREELLYHDRVVQQTQAALDVSLRGYESGNVTFADIISSYKIWLQARLNRYKERSHLESAWAKLERTVGAKLR